MVEWHPRPIVHCALRRDRVQIPAWRRVCGSGLAQLNATNTHWLAERFEGSEAATGAILRAVVGFGSLLARVWVTSLSQRPWKKVSSNVRYDSGSACTWREVSVPDLFHTRKTNPPAAVASDPFPVGRACTCCDGVGRGGLAQV